MHLQAEKYNVQVRCQKKGGRAHSKSRYNKRVREFWNSSNFCMECSYIKSFVLIILEFQEPQQHQT